MHLPQRGFTLVELLLVLVVLATVLSMAIPATQASIQRHTDAVICHKVRGSLLAARQAAIDSQIITVWDARRMAELDFSQYTLELRPEQPIRFSPDGTASDAALSVVRRHHRTIVGKIYVVGSTGAILSQSESSQW